MNIEQQFRVGFNWVYVVIAYMQAIFLSLSLNLHFTPVVIVVV